MTAPTRIAVIDFETRSAANLKKTGVEKYAEHPTTEVLMLCWAFDDGPVRAWCPRLGVDEGLSEILEHVAAGGLVVAHNARFEVTLWAMQTKRHGWPALPTTQTRCTMALGRTLALPGSLDQMCKALRLPVEKDQSGHRIMLRMCKPRKPHKGERDDVLHWVEDAANMRGLLSYCRDDVEAERALYRKLPNMIDDERAFWTVDQRINDRGVYLDLQGVVDCRTAAEHDKARLTAELRKLTGGIVPSANATDKLRGWMRTNGLELADVKKLTIENALQLANISAPIRRALEIRQEFARSSVAKLDAMLHGVSGDGRARGLLEYHGASTGRAAGRRIQTQNMIRPPEGFDVADAVLILSFLRLGAYDVVAAFYGSVMSAVAWSLRCLIMAAPGNELLTYDFANIEGRVLAWLAGEDWKLDAFRNFDAGNGPDMYYLAFSSSFGVPVDKVTKDQRQIGKVQELALGYQGAHGAFLSMASNYRIDLEKIAAAVKAATRPNRWDDAMSQYWAGARESAEEILAARRAEELVDLWHDDEDDDTELQDLMRTEAAKKRYGLKPETWSAIRIIVDGWRTAHPATVYLWRQLEDASKLAVERPGTIQSAGPIRYCKVGDVLYARLPSGRSLAYPYPRIASVPDKFSNKPTRKLLYEGVSSRTRKWQVQSGYGGLLAENVTQAAARDVLRDAIMRLERQGFPVVMHVHDEIVCEAPAGSKSLDEMADIMSASDSWAKGLPVAVAGWQGDRYRK